VFTCLRRGRSTLVHIHVNMSMPWFWTKYSSFSIVEFSACKILRSPPPPRFPHFPQFW
jgi:hypothetical protein